MMLKIIMNVALQGVRGGLHLMSFLVRTLFRNGNFNRKKKKTLTKEGGMPRNKISDPGPLPVTSMVEETLRYGLFLGSFSGVFVASDEMIACFIGKEKTKAWRAMLSGLLAGPTLLLAGTETGHTSLALYILIRGITLLVRCGNLAPARSGFKGWLRRVTQKVTRWKHGDVALMCLSTMQLGYSWIILPSTLPKSYIRFLNTHGGKHPVLLEGVREMCSRYSKGIEEPGCLAALKGTVHEGHKVSIPCEILHPGISCGYHSITFFPAAYLRALPVYLPVYIIPASLVHRHKLLAKSTAPVIWPKVLMGCLRSSLFLSLYCTLAWRGACFGFTSTRRVSGSIIAGTCWVAGLATLAEKKSRRMELALYCTSRAIESFGLCLQQWGYVPPHLVPKRIDVLLFSAAAAAICHCYSDHCGARRDVFAGKYLTVFDFIFGNTGFEGAAIRHIPSNSDIVKGLGSRARSIGRSINKNLSSLPYDVKEEENGNDDDGDLTLDATATPSSYSDTSNCSVGTDKTSSSQSPSSHADATNSNGIQ